MKVIKMEVPVKIKVFCGKTIESFTNRQMHPVNEVLAAKAIIDSNESIETYSNSPDFVIAIKYLAENKKVDIEFFLDGVSQGIEIDPIFGDFNKGIDLFHELTGVEI